MIKNILIGIQAYSGVLKLMYKLKLWKYFAVPILISFVTGLAIFTSAYVFSDYLGDYITSILPGWNSYSWLKTTFKILTSFIILLLGLILFKHIVMAFSAPFMSPVSEKIETYLVGEKISPRNTSFSEQLWRGIRINMRNLFMELLLTIPILILSFIPVLGLVAPILLFLVQAYYAGFGNMDYTLERHFNYSESIKFVNNHRGLSIGIGIVFILFLFIPVVGVILVLPLSVTAASIKTVEVIQQKQN